MLFEKCNLNIKLELILHNILQYERNSIIPVSRKKYQYSLAVFVLWVDLNSFYNGKINLFYCATFHHVWSDMLENFKEIFVLVLWIYVGGHPYIMSGLFRGFWTPSLIVRQSTAFSQGLFQIWMCKTLALMQCGVSAWYK